MSDQQPICPKCQYQYTYQDGEMWICPDCNHTWNPLETTPAEVAEIEVIRDANGNELQDGDSVSVIKDLKVKGASGSVKVGTKVRNIRLVFGSGDGHNISCKIEGFGAMNLKSEFVKKC